jgi:hypothetical protein
MVRCLVRFAAAACGLGLSAAGAASQIIPVRTVPLAVGDQFLMLPSTSLGMGGLELAVDDSLADPWSNPAKGVFVAGPALLGSPTVYSVSGGGSSGRTFPVAGLVSGRIWSGGAALAMQQLDAGHGQQNWVTPLTDVYSYGYGPPAELLSDANARNLYVQAFLTRRIADGPWSAGLGLSAASLDALDGVDLLYADAARVVQAGGTDDVRLGLYRRGAHDRLSLVAARNRIHMTHDVTYYELRWLPPVPDGGQTPVWAARTDHNVDETHTWAFQASWDRDLTAPGWRLGTSATVNRKTHPKIPNYEIQNIPRDPGTTWAYELGVGLSRTRGPTTFGIDMLFQPIWSDTWQEADTATATAAGGTIPAGDRTIENDFSFQNAILRVGLSHDVARATIQAGLEARSYDYSLDQKDHVTGTFRDQKEHWMEWTPTLGATLRFSDLELRYVGRATTGTGRPGVILDHVPAVADDPAADFLVTPSGPLTLQDATVLTHQLSVRIPIR